jgi:peptidoglycan/LPS O-acetylase OafA/YrhL
VNVRAYHFPLMDAVRGIAVIAVVAAHSSVFMSLTGSHSLSSIRFDFSVRVFFMISAFLLYRPWVRARLAGWDAPSAKAFAWRRLLRIVPAYYLALTVIAIWLGLSYVFGARGIPTYYGFAQVYQPGWAVGGLPQAWTLNVEIVFYALLPVWGGLMRRMAARSVAHKLRQEIVGCAVLVLVSFLYKVIVTSTGAIGGPEGVPFQLNTLTFLDDFAIGMALGAVSAAFEGRRDQPGAIRLLDRRPELAWGFALALVLITSLLVGFFGEVAENIQGAPYVERHYLLAAIGVALLLPAMFGDPSGGGAVRRVLRNRVLAYLGMISYGLYLWHFAVLVQLERWNFQSVAADVGAWVWFPAALLGGTLLATVSYYVVEIPFLRLKGLVKSRPGPQPGEAIEEPAPIAPPRPQTG